MNYIPQNNRNNDKDEETIGSFYMGRMRPPPPPPERSMPKGVLTVIALLLFAAIIWYAYPEGQEQYEGVDVPVIQADAAVYKSKPDDPGGMEVRHQDSTIFDPLERKGAEAVERLLPTTEEPVDKEVAVLSKDAPQLNLDTQMQEVTKGTEKLVFADKPAEKKAEELAKAEKPADKKPVEKKTDEKKPADKKTAEKKAEPVGTPAVAGASTYIRLGSYKNKAGASEDWVKFRRQYPQYLNGLDMRVVPVDLGAKGTFHRLEAGKLTAVRAKEICAALVKASGGCIVVK